MNYYHYFLKLCNRFKKNIKKIRRNNIHNIKSSPELRDPASTSDDEQAQAHPLAVDLLSEFVIGEAMREQKYYVQTGGPKGGIGGKLIGSKMSFWIATNNNMLVAVLLLFFITITMLS